MKIICNAEDLMKQGVYIIRCMSNNKIYVGSTTVMFIKRFWHHSNQLERNNHKNQHLQNSYNKYGNENFEFDILEICDKLFCLEREQEWINKTNCIDKNIGFNINPIASGTPNMSKETIEKRTKTLRLFRDECIAYYNKFKNNKITLNEIPKKFIKTIIAWSSEISNDGEFIKGKEPWNKGKKYSSTNHLKVSKTITEELKQAWKNTSERAREKYPEIDVFDINMNFLGRWRSAKDLEEFSMTSENNLPIKSRFKGTERRGVPVNVLQSVNINKSCKTNKTYKNLYFKFVVPLQEEILDEKLTNIGEGCDANTEINN